MKILLTGATGAIGSLLLKKLLDQEHEVIAFVRNKNKLPSHPRLSAIVGDLDDANTLKALPTDIDIAYYLVHSMSCQSDFAKHEQECANNFVDALSGSKIKHLIFLSGIANEAKHTKHIDSRQAVEFTFRKSDIPTTILRAGIIIGEGSAPFEIIRDLVERLPIMTPPRWVNNFCQPIAIDDVISYLINAASEPKCVGHTFDIGGPDILSYRKMLLECARVRGLKRVILSFPVLTPYLASLWLLLITKVNLALCSHLVENILNNFICCDNTIDAFLPQDNLTYEESLRRAFSPSQIPPQLCVSVLPLATPTHVPTQTTNYFGDLWIQNGIATFRPRGLLGRCYWHILKPWHKVRLNRLVKAPHAVHMS